jgi:hypothetical protein
MNLEAFKMLYEFAIGDACVLVVIILTNKLSWSGSSGLQLHS